MSGTQLSQHLFRRWQKPFSDLMILVFIPHVRGVGNRDTQQALPPPKFQLPATIPVTLYLPWVGDWRSAATFYLAAERRKGGVNPFGACVLCEWKSVAFGNKSDVPSSGQRERAPSQPLWWKGLPHIPGQHTMCYPLHTYNHHFVWTSVCLFQFQSCTFKKILVSNHVYWSGKLCLSTSSHRMATMQIKRIMDCVLFQYIR